MYEYNITVEWKVVFLLIIILAITEFVFKWEALGVLPMRNAE